MNRNSQSGFTLLELAMVIGVVAVLMAGSMKLLEPYIITAQRNATLKIMNNIADSLSQFAKIHGYLPCPGRPDPTTEPFGAPKNTDSTGVTISDDSCGLYWTDHVGIVPFRALGLEEGMVYDGFDNLITYSVSASVAGNIRSPGSGGVHEQCRTQAWREPASNTNKNEFKARMCCPGFIDTLGDITLYDQMPMSRPAYFGNHSSSHSRYSTPDDFLPYGTEPEKDNELIAFVLVSHGNNGDGAYQAQSAATNPVTADPNALESENRNGDTNFITHELQLRPGTDYFDDIVVWRTNHQVVSAFGDDSCARP